MGLILRFGEDGAICGVESSGHGGGGGTSAGRQSQERLAVVWNVGNIFAQRRTLDLVRTGVSREGQQVQRPAVRAAWLLEQLCHLLLLGALLLRNQLLPRSEHSIAAQL